MIDKERDERQERMRDFSRSSMKEPHRRVGLRDDIRFELDASDQDREDLSELKFVLGEHETLIKKLQGEILALDVQLLEKKIPMCDCGLPFRVAFRCRCGNGADFDD